MCVEYSLSAKQIHQFREDGFLVLRNSTHSLVTSKELQDWSTNVQSLPKINGKWMHYDEVNTRGEKQLMRTEYFVDFHDAFRGLLCGRQLAFILSQLSGQEMLLFKDKINYKQPDGNGFHAHLDAPAYDHIGKIEHLTANFAANAATLENGCLEVVPGSHRMNVTFSRGGRIDREWESSHDWVPVPLEPGDVLFFGSHLAHRSGPNHTAEARASVYATYHGKSDGLNLREKYYADRRVAFPPDYERVESKDYSEGWIRYGFAAPFAPETAAPNA